MPLRSLLLLLSALVLVPSVALAAWERKGTASVTFFASGPVGLSIEGNTPELEVSEAENKLLLRVPLAKLDTGISLRNQHMREKYLEVDRYPAATLALPKAALKLPKDGASETNTTTGSLTIRDRTHSVPVRYTVTRDGSLHKVRGEFTLNIKDFGIEVPSYLGVTVKPKVRVKARFEVVAR
jgi:polyisoprenoid-binding protein YceI